MSMSMSMHVQVSADQHEVWVCINVRAGHYSERWAIVSLPDLQARHDMLWTRDSAQHTEPILRPVPIGKKRIKRNRIRNRKLKEKEKEIRVQGQWGTAHILVSLWWWHIRDQIVHRSSVPKARLVH